VGIGEAGPIEAWVPMMLFTILFGLSMDYEIFLLSRVREDYLKNQDNGLAVANGVAVTGRVITAAAAIMVAVFLSFVLGFGDRARPRLTLGAVTVGPAEVGFGRTPDPGGERPRPFPARIQTSRSPRCR